MERDHHKLKITLVLLLFSTLYMLPSFLEPGIPMFPKQDFPFHLARITGLGNAFVSPVNFLTYGNNGTAMNLFYPWLTLYPAYLLFRVTGNLVFAYKGFYFLVTFLTMLFAYLAGKRMLKRDSAAFFFALLYGFASYRSTDLFYRSAMGEAIALTFLPLVLLGCWYIFYDDYRKWHWLAIGMALTAHTHVLSVLLNSLFIGIGLLICLFRADHKGKRFASLIKAATVTILLSLAFFAPMFEQTAALKLKVPSATEVETLPIDDLLAGITLNNLQLYGIGLVLFLAILFILQRWKNLRAFERMVFLIGIVTLFATMEWSPWVLLEQTPLLRIQFAWRLSAYASICLAYVAAAALPSFALAKRKLAGLSLPFLIVGLHFFSLQQLYQSEEMAMWDNRETLQVVRDYGHTDYANRASLEHRELIREMRFLVEGVPAEVEYTFSDSVFSFRYANLTDQPIELTTPLYFYKGQAAEGNGAVAETSLSDHGTTAIVLPPETNSVRITYRYTTLARTAQTISLLTLLLFLIQLGKNTRPCLLEKRA